MTIRYQYIDHNTHTLRALGDIHSRLTARPVSARLRGLLLHTCHRVEWYTSEVGVSPVPEIARRPWIYGEVQCFARIAQIAAGTQSIIPGDRFVLRQVVQAHARMAENSRLHQIVAEGISLAREARKRFDLVPVVDYSDIPRAWKELSPKMPGAGANKLLIVGGGLLAQAIASSSGRSYAQIVMVTRSPSRLGTSFASRATSSQPFAIVSAQQAIQGNTSDRFDLVIATASVNRAYREHLLLLANHSNVGRIFDFCAVPLACANNSRYQHVFVSGLPSWVTDANAAVEKRALLALEWIASVAGDRLQCTSRLMSAT